jgi:hypothetical protein
MVPPAAWERVRVPLLAGLDWPASHETPEAEETLTDPGCVSPGSGIALVPRPPKKRRKT